MAFEFLRSENNASPIEKEIIATNATTYKHGQLVAYGSDGTAVAGSANPEFVYVGKDTTAKTGDILAVIPVLPEYEFETTLSAAGTSLKPGAKVTVTNEQATATTTSGVFELLTAGGASGATVVGKFA